MNLTDRLHCPCCKGRLTALAATAPMASSTEHPLWSQTGPLADTLTGVAIGSAARSPGGTLHCTSCSGVVPVLDGIADFVGDRVVSASDSRGYNGDPCVDSAAPDDLQERIRAAAGDLWPVTLGQVLELGCGGGQLTHGLALNGAVHGLMVTDTAIGMVRACRDRLAMMDLGQDEPVAYVRLSGHEDAIRDAVADTVAGAAVLPRYGNVRELLATVHRVLKPGGRAFFVLPNRRYHQALCHAMAAALVRQYARDRAWPDSHDGAMHWLADLRRRLIHQGDQTFLSALRDKHLFDSDALEDLAREVGFATADVIPLDPDPLGGETARRCCREAALADAFTAELAPLIVSAGAPLFSLLSRQDSSASMLLWLTKGIGPSLRTFSPRPKPPSIGLAGPDSALGGVPPRWSLELLARDTEDGVVVSVGGWCLVNTDVLWMRLTLDGITRDAPVWRPRPDVHEVLNTHGLYTPFMREPENPNRIKRR